MSAPVVGVCAFCGARLAPDGSRTCSCAPRSRPQPRLSFLAEVSMLASELAADEADMPRALRAAAESLRQRPS